MNDSSESLKNEPGAGSNQSAESDAWREVGRQFQQLGESLATAFKTAIESPQTQQAIQEVKTGIEVMAKEVDRAVKEAAQTPEGQRVREETEKAIHTAQVVGEETIHEARPHLLSALREMNEALRIWISRLEGDQPESNEPKP